MDWFNFLKSEGYFEPKQNPDPIQVKDGLQFPLWEVLTYLEKLSIQISQGEKTELIDELIDFIKNVSDHPKDNYRTWYLLLKILANIPNEKIPTDIFDYIPIWLSSKFDTMMQTSELCEKLLPKFLNDHPTEEDIKKAEKILCYLFQIEKVDGYEITPLKIKTSYRSRVYLHFLSEKINKGDIIPKIIKHCSSDFLLDLGRTIKYLLLDYPDGIHKKIVVENIEYEINISIEKENLIINSIKDNKETKTVNTPINNWNDKTKTQLKQELVSIFKRQNINYKPTKKKGDLFEALNFLLTNDYSSSGLFSIRKLEKKYSKDDCVLDVFSLIFRNLLNEKVKQDPKEGIKLLEKFCFDKKYHLPFFIRISLYVVSENWEISKTLFLKLIQNNDALKLFSNYKYKKELFDLLNRSQNKLKKEEIEIIEKIIKQGKQIESKKNDDIEYWQLGWYSALKEIDPFKEKYIALSNKLNLTSEHFENSGEIRVSYGSVSPISKDDLLNKSNKEIVDYIKNFKPKRHFDEPSISGLSETFGRSIEEEPEKFVSEIELYLDIPYTYYYRMSFALGNAWKNQKNFDWEKVLNFCITILNNPKFYSETPTFENDELNTKPESVIGQIGILLTCGLQDDKNAIDVKLLPLAKTIIFSIVSTLIPVEKIKDINNTDYPTYSLNSTAGQSLRALLDYSLHRARNLFSLDENKKWEDDIKLMFEETLKKGIVDGYILEGMYFEQFYYLDKEWIIEQVKQLYYCDEKKIIAFMGGFVFHNPPFNKEIYDLFYPLYANIIKNNISYDNYGVNGLVRHLTAFYFWNYETLSSEKLLFLFIKYSNPKGIGDLIHYIWQQEKYPQNLNESEIIEFQKNIFELWVYLAHKYENSTEEIEQVNLANLSNFVVFFPILNEEMTNLILKSCKNVNKIYSTHQLLKNLKKIIQKGNPHKNAIELGKILSGLNLREYLDGLNKNIIRELVKFLFDYGQGDLAGEFCNKMAVVHQEFFLRDLYNTYLNKNK